jgi:fatty acid desaturase
VTIEHDDQGVKPRSVSSYVREVRPSLPSHAFDPVPSRLLWLTLNVAIIAAGTVALARGWGGWWAALPLALVIGHSFAGAAFVGHEALHGAVVRSVFWRSVVGWISFLPFTLSPRLWVAWHNKTHHAHTMSPAPGRDPDAYPTLATYRRERLTRVADYFSFAAERPLGVVTLALGFTGQMAQMLLRWSRRPEGMAPVERRWAMLETLAGVAVWATVGWLLGPAKFVFAFVIPLLIGNAIVIGYILTNHSLSPLTEVNDPLLNSLTVTAPGWVQRLHLNFGLHVEHHLFPSMSSAYAPLVRAELQKRWPERYQSLPVLTALALLARTPRVYSSATQLHDPRTGLEASTILPRSAPAAESTGGDDGPRPTRDRSQGDDDASKLERVA